jgi:hypothetical protein
MPQDFIDTQSAKRPSCYIIWISSFLNGQLFCLKCEANRDLPGTLHEVHAPFAKNFLHFLTSATILGLDVALLFFRLLYWLFSQSNHNASRKKKQQNMWLEREKHMLWKTAFTFTLSIPEGTFTNILRNLAKKKSSGNPPKKKNRCPSQLDSSGKNSIYGCRPWIKSLATCCWHPNLALVLRCSYPDLRFWHIGLGHCGAQIIKVLCCLNLCRSTC